jgi:dihydrolipoamide dehydrogenase
MAYNRANNDIEGFVKIPSDATTDRLLGARSVGPHAGNLIAELALAIQFGASAEDVGRTCYAHQPRKEAIKDAALAATRVALKI